MKPTNSYAKRRPRFRKPLLLPPERSAHGEHDYEIVLELSAKLVAKNGNESGAVAQAFALLDKCQDLLKGRPYSLASVARVAAEIVESDRLDDAARRALAIAETYAEIADQRHRLRVRRGMTESLRFLSKPSKSATGYAKMITQEDRPDRALAKMKAFLVALARGDIPQEIEPQVAWLKRPPADPRSVAMDTFVEQIRRGEIPRHYLLSLQKPFEIYHDWLKKKKCADSGALRHKK